MVSGEIGVKEIEILIKKLQIDKESSPMKARMRRRTNRTHRRPSCVTRFHGRQQEARRIGF
jgi:hypothetical protein